MNNKKTYSVEYTDKSGIPCTLFFHTHGNQLHVDSVKCGMTFSSIVIIYNFTNPNPLVCVPKPLGVWLVSTILNALQELKKNHEKSSVEAPRGL